MMVDFFHAVLNQQQKKLEFLLRSSLTGMGEVTRNDRTAYFVDNQKK